MNVFIQEPFEDFYIIQMIVYPQKLENVRIMELKIICTLSINNLVLQIFSLLKYTFFP